jgi:hypothetical protein
MQLKEEFSCHGYASTPFGRAGFTLSKLLLRPTTYEEFKMVDEIPLKVALKQPVSAQQWTLDNGLIGIKCVNARISDLGPKRLECIAGSPATERDGHNIYVRCPYGDTVVEE